MRSLDLLNKKGLRFNIITTVTSLNVDDLPGLMEVLMVHGTKAWRLQPLIPVGRVKDSTELKIESQTIQKIGDFLKQNKQKALEKELELISADGLQYVFEEEKTTTKRPWIGCPAGWCTCGITSDGKIKGCLSMPDELVEGDLRKNDLWDIWFHPDAFAYNRKYSSKQIGSNCIECDMRENCKGGCSVSSFTSTGSFHNDPYCYYMTNKKTSKRIICDK